jgi:arylamine N-acetyltransferase
MIRPIVLAEAHYNQPPFELGLDKLDDHYWRFWENFGEGRFTFDFKDETACERLLAEKCEFLQTDSSSNFVLNLVAQQRSRTQHRTLRGRIFSVVTATSRKSHLVDSPDALVAILANEFRLDAPEVAGLWSRIVERHDQLFGDRSF